MNSVDRWWPTSDFLRSPSLTPFLRCDLRYLRRLLIKIKVSRRLRDRLGVRLAQGFLEPLRQCVAARSLRGDRLLKKILAAPGLFFHPTLGVAHLRHFTA